MAIPGRDRPTLEAVAAHVGVSRATVSRVVNGSPKVSPEVRQLVEGAVRELGYVPNLAARTLVTQRTETIAMVLSEPESLVLDDPFFSTIIRTTSRELSVVGLQLVLLMVNGEDESRRAERFIAGGHVDGAIALAPHRRDRLPAVVRSLPLPVVFAGRPWGRVSDLLYVDFDNRAGARTATRHLFDIGRTKVATVTGPQDEYAAVQRLRGYRDVAGDADPRLVAQGDYTRPSGEAAMTALLEQSPDIDGVFVASDAMAAGALRALSRAGRRIPDDVAVTSYDDVEQISRWTDPPLTTVRQSVADMGIAVVKLLLARMAGETPVKPVMLLTELVVRESA